MVRVHIDWVMMLGIGNGNLEVVRVGWRLRKGSAAAGGLG